MKSASDSELGKKSVYDTQYNPNRLVAIPREEKRREIGIDPAKPPFFGFDCWNHYEVSWLNDKGKPVVATAEIIYDCNSPALVESKSLKLYFNSLNNSSFGAVEDVEQLISADLTQRIGTPVWVEVTELSKNINLLQACFSGQCLDELDVVCDAYEVDPSLLVTSDEFVEETVYSDLLKSNCLITHQPDWGSVQIIYAGKKINHEGLLKYIVSFRNHNEFHEQCIERIYIDIMNRCQPDSLTVYGRYTRRGGLDINPYRSSMFISDYSRKNTRLLRQ